jgi:hypothetical protein
MKKESLEAKKEAYKSKRKILLGTIKAAVDKVTQPLKKHKITFATFALMGISTLATSCATYAMAYPQQEGVYSSRAPRSGDIIQYKNHYYKYDYRFSQGLNYMGMMDDNGNICHEGYQGAYRQCTQYGDVLPNGNVIVVPNNTDNDGNEEWQQNVLRMEQKDRTGPYRPSNMIRVRGGRPVPRPAPRPAPRRGGVYRHSSWDRAAETINGVSHVVYGVGQILGR